MCQAGTRRAPRVTRCPSLFQQCATRAYGFLALAAVCPLLSECEVAFSLSRASPSWIVWDNSRNFDMSRQRFQLQAAGNCFTNGLVLVDPFDDNSLRMRKGRASSSRTLAHCGLRPSFHNGSSGLVPFRAPGLDEHVCVRGHASVAITW